MKISLMEFDDPYSTRKHEKSSIVLSCLINRCLFCNGSFRNDFTRLVQKKHGKSKGIKRLPRFKESDYMDPQQGLCLGALFDIAATNGLDMGRRLCIFGFCRSIEMLSDVVEDTVLEHGGEVVAAQKATKGGLHEKLTMKVAVPLLWGVPPASETLHLAVQSGGGIVEKIYWQWDFL
ncbi:hypothetical protein QQ045_022998 [Rhodiola kirilowii]